MKAIAPLVCCLLVACVDDVEGDGGPTTEEMEDVARARCEQIVECDPGSDVVVEECVDGQLAAYQRGAECVAVFRFDECLIGQTCEEVELLAAANVGECLEAKDAKAEVSCGP